MKDRILIVEDEADLLQGLERVISREVDCLVLTAQNAIEALDVLRNESVDLVLADIRMPDMDGLELLRATKKIDPSITVIMMTAYGSVEQAVQAIKDGAYDFVLKPFDEDQLIHLLKKGLERNRLVRENARLLKQVSEQSPFQNIVGKSAKMQDIFNIIQMVAPTDVTVLLLGESGTGKEMAARAIHEMSNRCRHDMVTINCPALPENILESELFGYRKGAFTNANFDKKGLFKEADGSTIFLDEIGDLSPALQTKLLRVLQEKEIKPLGDNKTTRIDVRIIASTNRDLKTKMESGSFREDLFYRLDVATLTMPPLRDRKEDLPLLTEHFLNKAAREQNVPPKKIIPEALNVLISRRWTGNVRELENSIRRLTAMTPGSTITAEDIAIPDSKELSACESIDLSQPYKLLKQEVLKEFTASYVMLLLEKTRGNVSIAAQQSGIKRQSLQKIIKRYGIDAARFRK